MIAYTDIFNVNSNGLPVQFCNYQQKTNVNQP
jgi:hypothetical protein